MVLIGRNHVRVSLTHVHWILSALKRIHRVHGLLIPHSCLIESNFTKNLKLFICVSCDWGYCLASIELFLTHNSLTNVNTKPITPVTDISEAEVQVITGKANPVANSLHQTLTLLAILKLLIVLDNLWIA